MSWSTQFVKLGFGERTRGAENVKTYVASRLPSSAVVRLEQSLPKETVLGLPTASKLNAFNPHSKAFQGSSYGGYSDLQVASVQPQALENCVTLLAQSRSRKIDC